MRDRGDLDRFDGYLQVHETVTIVFSILVRLCFWFTLCSNAPAATRHKPCNVT